MNTAAQKVMRWGSRLAVLLYRRSNGRIAGSARGLPVLLLTVPGRRTGKLHTVAVSYFEKDGSYLVTGSAGGMKDDPQWMKNLRATPTAHIRIGAREVDVRVHVTDPEQRDELWRDVVTAQAPFFAGYQEKSGRVIPIAILEPREGPDRAA